MTLKTQWLGSFAGKAIVCTTKVRDKTFRNAKRYEDSVSSPPKKKKYGRTYFLKSVFPSKKFT